MLFSTTAEPELFSCNLWHMIGEFENRSFGKFLTHILDPSSILS